MKRVIVHTLEVSEPGEQVYFQIDLPDDVERLTGLQVTENTTYTVPGGVPAPGDSKTLTLTNSLKVGTLRLQVSGTYGCCNVSEVIRNDNSLVYGNFDQLSLIDDKLKEYAEDWWIAGTKWEPLDFEIDKCSTIIFGFFEDAYILKREDEPGYQVKIYIHYESKQKCQ